MDNFGHSTYIIFCKVWLKLYTNFSIRNKSTMKKCSRCKEEKPLSEFYCRNKELWKYYYHCKECDKKRQRWKRKENIEYFRERDRGYYENDKEVRARKMREYRAKNREKMREQNMKSKYGLLIVDYDKKLVDQGHCCAICGKHQDNNHRRLCIDHDHLNWKARWLLCDWCNRWLGYYETWKNEYEVYLKKYS